jgi:hypothetical protein
MDLNYVTDYDTKIVNKLNKEGYDLDSLIFMCKELLDISSELLPGDLKEFIYRLKNRCENPNAKNFDSKGKLEDNSPSKITFQPVGYKNVFFFTRSKGQSDLVYRQATYYCEICGPQAKFYKKEIKGHINGFHKKF